MQKSELRKINKKKRSEMTRDDVLEKSREAALFFLSSEIYKKSRVLMLYMPLGNETDTSFIMERAIADGKKIVLPVTDLETMEIIAYYVDSDTEFEIGAYSIKEPKMAEIADERDIDAVVVPGIAFSKSGARIGFGKGFYDRFLKKCNAVKIGFCYGYQISDNIKPDSHDIAMDYIVSELGMHNASRRSIMELSPRLKKIADLIPENSRMADVGTDHAYIPIYCLENKIIKSAIAMDINPMPLNRAQINLEKYGFLESAELRLSNGIEKLERDEVDVVVIAGMGGLLIRDIIDAGKDKISESTLLLIQPMIAPMEFRCYLFENGFDILDEYVVREENKFYNIFAVKKGEAKPDEEKIHIGKNLRNNSPEVFEDYMSYKIRVARKIIAGMEKAESPDAELLEKNKKELEIYLRYSKGEKL